jgi:hypothetical protein
MTFSVGNARFGVGQGIALSDGSGESESLSRILPNGEYFNIAVAHKLDNTGLTSIRVGGGSSNTTAHLGLVFDPTGRVTLRAFTSTIYNIFVDLASVIVPGVAVNQYLFVSCSGRIHATLGEVRVAINGVEVPGLAVSNVDTLNVSTGQLWAQLGPYGATSGGGTSNWIYDDYVDDDSASVTLIPERRVYVQRPSGDGATLLLVPSTGVSHFGVIDEGVVTTTDYLSGSAVNDLDLILLTDLAYVPAVIDGVNVIVNAQKTDAIARSIDVGVLSGATVASSPDRALNSSAAFYDSGRLLTDPNTGAAWSFAGVNALQARPRVSV